MEAFKSMVASESCNASLHRPTGAVDRAGFQVFPSTEACPRRYRQTAADSFSTAAAFQIPDAKSVSKR